MSGTSCSLDQYNTGQGLTVLTVSSGGLSLMSVMLISAVAVLDKPKFRFPSMSVAWTMMVYWETFCRPIKKHKGETVLVCWV